MFLIDSDSSLRSYFPNVFASAPSEPSFYDKLTPYLQQAEDWISSNIVSVELLKEALDTPKYKAYNLKEHVYDKCRALAVAWAMHAAAPSLDLALAANGFVTTGTQSAVPISTFRMERLQRSLATSIDFYINSLLGSLHLLPGWVASPQGSFFGESLFQNMDICILVRKSDGEAEPSELCRFPRFERFLFLRAKAIEIESAIADSFISRELMQKLRERLLFRDAKAADHFLVKSIKEQVLKVLNGFMLDHHALCHAVNYIRNNKKEFPQWFTSPVAKLFDDDSFKNELSSPGYFF